MEKKIPLREQLFREPEEWDIYGGDYREELVDNDELEPWEAAWMSGYEEDDAM